MEFTPYLSFSGQCEEAFKLYEKCFGGKILFIATYGESPMAGEVPPDWGKKIMHATLDLDGRILQGADAFPQQYQKPQGFSISIGLGDPSEAERIFKTLAEHGTVEMPLQETFWASRFGSLVDQFGTPWTINCEKQ